MIPHLTILKKILWKFIIFAHVSPPCIQHANPSSEWKTNNNNQTRRRLHLSSIFLVWYSLNLLKLLMVMFCSALKTYCTKTYFLFLEVCPWPVKVISFELTWTSNIGSWFLSPKISFQKIIWRGNISWWYPCHNRFMKNLHMKL